MSDTFRLTPRTDAEAYWLELRQVVDVDFSRKLECENAALRAANATLREMIDLAFSIPGMSDDQLAKLIANCRAAIDAARKEQP